MHIQSVHALPLSSKSGLIVILQEVFMLKGNIPGMKICREIRIIIHKIFSAELNIIVMAF